MVTGDLAAAGLGDSFGLDAEGGGLALVPLAEIVEVPEWQPRDGTSEATIRRYASAYEAGAEMPPLLVARVMLGCAGACDGGGQVRLALLDGWHRLAALRSLGRDYAECRVLPGVLTEQDAAWRAAEANLRHGLPLKTREVRKAFRAYVRAGQHRRERQGGAMARQQQAFKSYRDMAAELGGVSHNSVRNWMFGDFLAVARAIAGASAAVGGGDLPALGQWSGEPSHTRAESSVANRAVEALGIAGEALRVVQAPDEKRRIAREVFALAAALEADGFSAAGVEAEMAALEEAPDF